MFFAMRKVQMICTMSVARPDQAGDRADSEIRAELVGELLDRGRAIAEVQRVAAHGELRDEAERAGDDGDDAQHDQRLGQARRSAGTCRRTRQGRRRPRSRAAATSLEAAEAAGEVGGGRGRRDAAHGVSVGERRSCSRCNGVVHAGEVGQTDGPWDSSIAIARN